MVKVMKSKSISELWEEFVGLGWSGVRNNVLGEKVQDLEIYPMVFLRKYKGDWSVYYLPISTVLIIPASWTSIWSEFNIWIGDELKEWMKESTEITKKREQFGINFLYWVSHIERNLCGSPKNELFEETLKSVIELGTEEWRDWCKKEFNIDLLPWTIMDLEGIREV